MNEPEVECEKCGWQGFVSELECGDEDWESGKLVADIGWNRCPICGSADVHDIDEE